MGTHQKPINLRIGIAIVQEYAPEEPHRAKDAADGTNHGEVHVILNVIIAKDFVLADEQITIKDRRKVHPV